MSLHANLRAVDKSRAVRAMTAWACEDSPALDGVLAETADDPIGANGLVFALLSYVDWITGNTGPLTDAPPDVDDQP